MVARAYTTTLNVSDDWSGPGLDVVSVPVEFTESLVIEDVVGILGLDADTIVHFEASDVAQSALQEHFREAGVAGLVEAALFGDFVVIEESPGKAKPLSAVAATGAIATGFAVFGPWAILALPVGVFLLAAAPEAGHGFGRWVRHWFDSKTDQGR